MRFMVLFDITPFPATKNYQLAHVVCPLWITASAEQKSCRHFRLLFPNNARPNPVASQWRLFVVRQGDGNELHRPLGKRQDRRL